MSPRKQRPAWEDSWWDDIKILLWALALFSLVIIIPAALVAIPFGVVWLYHNNSGLLGVIVIALVLSGMIVAVILVDKHDQKRYEAQLQAVHRLEPLPRETRTMYSNNTPLPAIQDPKPKRSWTSWFQPPRPKHLDEKHDASKALLEGIAEIQKPQGES